MVKCVLCATDCEGEHFGSDYKNYIHQKTNLNVWNFYLSRNNYYFASECSLTIFCLFRFYQVPLKDAKICMVCENTLLKFRELEKKIYNFYGQKSAAGTGSTNEQPAKQNPSFAVANSSGQQLVKQNQPFLVTETSNQQSAQQNPSVLLDTCNKKREIGCRMRYLNKFSNTVETCTYIGMKNDKLKCSIGRANKQRFILIENKHVVDESD